MKNTILVLLFILTIIESQSQLNTIDRFGRTGDGYRPQNVDVPALKKSKIKMTEKNLTDSVITNQVVQNNRNVSKKFYLPLKKLIPTSGFGWRKHPVTGEHKFHTGIDLKAYYEPVYCIADGIVSFAGKGDIEGNYVIIDHGQVKSIYCHLSKISFSAGQIIKAGEVLGISGNTGRSTGAHLHFGLKWENEKVNPERLLELLKISGLFNSALSSYKLLFDST